MSGHYWLVAWYKFLLYPSFLVAERPTRLDLSLLLFLADDLDDIGAPCDSGKSTGIATADAIL
jgi:hypothetical protein